MKRILDLVKRSQCRREIWDQMKEYDSPFSYDPADPADAETLGKLTGLMKEYLDAGKEIYDIYKDLLTNPPNYLGEGETRVRMEDIGEGNERLEGILRAIDATIKFHTQK